jgi:LPS export ABC transporter protein LptC
MKTIIKSFLIFGVSFLVACTSIEEQSAAGSLDPNSIPDQESWKSTITITQDGKKFAEIWAGYISFYNVQGKTFLKDSIHGDFFDQDGSHNSVLTADSGIVFNQTNNLVAYGEVVVVSDSGIVLETRELRWENEKQKIISDVPVRFTIMKSGTREVIRVGLFQLKNDNLLFNYLS